MVEKNFKYSVLNQTFNAIEECILYANINGEKVYCNRSYIHNFEKDKNISDEDKKLITTNDIKEIKLKQDITKSKKIIDLKGNTRYFEFTKIPVVNEESELEGIFTIIKDRSYKYELEKLRTGFFSNIKHEFRTPLNMIFSSIQLIDSKCKICRTDNCKDCFINNLQIINTNSLRILKLSNNFIDLTNIQAGCMDFNPRNHDIVKFIESICDNINNYKRFNEISLIFDTSLEEHVIRFDTDKIERVILNLISNAIKFNVNKGDVFVSLVIESEYTIISVKDTGIGISEDKIQSIFESFANVENRLIKVSEGSGVGLALSKALINMHDGDINVKSKKGEGSEFIVTIPNVIDKSEEIDTTYNKVDRNSLEKIEMEFSDIYLY